MGFMVQSKQLKAQRNERNLSLLGSNLFLATPLARCPLVVRRNGPNLSTSASRCLAVSHRTTLLLHNLLYTTSWLHTSLAHPPLLASMINGGLRAAMLSRVVQVGQNFKQGVDSFSLRTISWQDDCEPGGGKSGKMEDKWTHQCSSGNQCSFRGC